MTGFTVVPAACGPIIELVLHKINALPAYLAHGDRNLGIAPRSLTHGERDKSGRIC